MQESEFILLDAFIIASFPQILDLNSKYYKLTTTTHVVMDIKNNFNVQLNTNVKKKVLEKIEAANQNGNLEIKVINLETDLLVPQDIRIEKLSSSEASLINLSYYIKDSNFLRIATMSDQLTKVSRANNIQTLSLNQLIEIYARHNNQSPSDLKLQIYYEYKDLLSLGNKFLIGVLSVGLLIVSFYYREIIIQKINVGGTIVLTIIIAILLYILRERQRIIYGIIEFGAGISSITLIFYPTFDLSNLMFDLSFSIKFLGGLYIMVRGIDNIVKGFSKTRTGEILKYKYRIGL